MTFAERAKPLKDKSKLTLSEIAAACNISESMVSRYINGQNIPTEDIARKMIDVLSAAVPVESKSEAARPELLVIRDVYEARIADMRASVADLKKQLRTEHKEKWIFFVLLIAVIAFVFTLLFVDIANGNVGWFRH